jgi:hypothetical protein
MADTCTQSADALVATLDPGRIRWLRRRRVVKVTFTDSRESFVQPLLQQGKSRCRSCPDTARNRIGSPFFLQSQWVRE